MSLVMVGRKTLNKASYANIRAEKPDSETRLLCEKFGGVMLCVKFVDHSCLLSFKWMREMWTSDLCYRINGVNGSVCSILIYLSEVNSFLSLTRVNPLSTSCQTNRVVFLTL